MSDKDHSRVSPEGKAVGAQLVRMTEPTIALLASLGEPDARCKTCAFRPETVPNGCLQTQADALKAVVEGVPFLCHQHNKRGEQCHGWAAATLAIAMAAKNAGKRLEVTCPWDFSLPD